MFEFDAECDRCKKIEKFSYDPNPQPHTMRWTLARNAMRSRGWYCARDLSLCKECTGIIARYSKRANT